MVLQKAAPGVKWGTWGEEKIGPATEDNGSSVSATTAPSTASQSQPAKATPAAPTATQKPTTTAAPAYPTSSRSGPKNWDNLGEGEDDDGKDDVNAFFKTLYKGATPEQQRAMMKSFIESNGTALSTDWNDVGNRKVETVPPEGVEAKKWDN